MPRDNGAAAVKKAEDLLFSWLTPEQQFTARLKTGPYFDVIGSAGGHYRIDMTTTVSNVYTINSAGEKTQRHCCYPHNAWQLPCYDTYLAQALSIRANEKEWLRIAVSHRVNPDGGNIARGDGFRLGAGNYAYPYRDRREPVADDLVEYLRVGDAEWITVTYDTDGEQAMAVARALRQIQDVIENSGD